VTSSAPDMSAAAALYVFDAEVESGKGEPFMVVYKGVPYPVGAAQGRELRWFENGSNDEVYIALPNGHFAKFTKSSNAPSDYSTSAYPVASFLANSQETYFGEKAVDLSSDEDDDFDGVPNVRETGRGMNPYSNDSDGDYVLDGVEQRWSTDTDQDGVINALDKDSDNDGVPDGTEDINRDGIRQANETDVLRQDTDYDSLQDGTELGYTTGTSDTCTSAGQSGCSSAWLMTPDAQGWTVTSPLDVDFDDDGIRDGLEDSDHNGRYDNGSETNATAPDTDGDLLWDGIETGVMVPTEGTNLALWRRDGSPFENTNPRSPDTDGDHLMDSVEDWNLDGLQTWGTNETDPILYDSDSDGLCDGNCSGKGEDLNLNGFRDQDEDGNWTETDALANDSDVDGILDGAEVNGTYCFSNQTSGCSHPALDPLNADSDGDQLRDGQEVAGWRVLVWREITMEKLENYTVVPLPWVQDTDGDGNSDFVEFQNGSDPWKADSDGDLMTDAYESANGRNVTGFFSSPPEIVAWSLGKENRGGNLVGVGKSTVAVVSFDIYAYWGVGSWVVRYGKPYFNASQEAEIKALTGTTGEGAVKLCAAGGMGGITLKEEKCQRLAEIIGQSQVIGKDVGGYGGGNQTAHAYAEFVMTWEEDLRDGVWIQAQANDVYGLGTQKTLKLKSFLEVVIDILQAVAKAIAEAVSFLLNLVLAMIKFLFEPILKLIHEAMVDWANSIGRALGQAEKDIAAAIPFGVLAVLGAVSLGVLSFIGAFFSGLFPALVMGLVMLLFVAEALIAGILGPAGVPIAQVLGSLVAPVVLTAIVGLLAQSVMDEMASLDLGEKDSPESRAGPAYDERLLSKRGIKKAMVIAAAVGLVAGAFIPACDIGANIMQWEAGLVIAGAVIIIQQLLLERVSDPNDPQDENMKALHAIRTASWLKTFGYGDFVALMANVLAFSLIIVQPIVIVGTNNPGLAFWFSTAALAIGVVGTVVAGLVPSPLDRTAVGWIDEVLDVGMTAFDGGSVLSVGLPDPCPP